MKHKPWNDYPESLYDGQNRGTFQNDILQNNIKNKITNLFRIFMENNIQLINTPEKEYIRNLPMNEYLDE